MFTAISGKTSGILQADAYKGYAKLYEPGADGISRFQEAACWAHLRRDFHDIWTSTKSEIAKEALDRIGALYDVERDIAGQPAEVRLAARQKLSRPKAEAFFLWAEKQRARIPGKSDLAKAFRYCQSRQASFCLFLDDGRIAIDNNAAERALRPIGIGRKNWLFAGADTGAETLARAMTIIETAKMNGLDPQAYLADILDRINDHKINRLDELLPWNWTPTAAHPVGCGLMAQTGYVLTLERVAEILDEDLKLIETIVANDDNLSFGSIVYVEMAAGNDSITALTADGVEELGQMLAGARSSQQEWNLFLADLGADPQVIARVITKLPR